MSQIVHLIILCSHENWKIQRVLKFNKNKNPFNNTENIKELANGTLNHDGWQVNSMWEIDLKKDDYKSFVENLVFKSKSLKRDEEYNFLSIVITRSEVDKVDKGAKRIGYNFTKERVEFCVPDEGESVYTF